MILYPWMYRVLVIGYCIFTLAGAYQYATLGDMGYLLVVAVGLIGVGFNVYCIRQAVEYWKEENK